MDLEGRYIFKNTKIHNNNMTQKASIIPQHKRVIEKILDEDDVVIVQKVNGYDKFHFGKKDRTPILNIEASIYFESEEKRKEFNEKGIIVRHTPKRPYPNHGYEPGCYDIVVFGKDEKKVNEEFERLVKKSNETKKRVRKIAFENVAPILEQVAKDNDFVEAIIFRGSVFNKYAYVQIEPEHPDIDVIILFDEKKTHDLNDFIKILCDQLYEFRITANEYVTERRGYNNVPIYRSKKRADIQIDFDFIPVYTMMNVWRPLIEKSGRRDYYIQTFSQAIIIFDRNGYGAEFIKTLLGK